jgi:tetratricopeptide (TPR) repeat protein
MDFFQILNDIFNAETTKNCAIDILKKRGAYTLSEDVTSSQSSSFLDELKEASKKNPYDVDLLINLGIFLTACRLFNEAIKVLKESVKIKPEPDAHIGIGLAHSNKGSFKKASHEFNEAIRLNPGDHTIYNHLGIVQLITGAFKDSVDNFSKAIAINPDYLDAYINRALTYYIIGHPLKAIDDLNITLEKEPNNPTIFNYRGQTFMKLKLYDRAIDDFTIVIKIAPELPDVFINRCQAYLNYNKYEEAVIDCTKSIDLKPVNAPAFYYRGYALEKLGQLEKAKKNYDMAIKIDADFVVSAYCRRAKEHKEAADYKEAIKDFSKAIKIDPKATEAYFGRSVLYLKLGKKQKAHEDIEKLRAVNPEMASMVEHVLKLD